MAMHMTRLSGARPGNSHVHGGRPRGGSSYAENARRTAVVQMQALGAAEKLSEEDQRRKEIKKRIRGQFDVSADDHDLGAPVQGGGGGWRMLRGIAAMLTFGANGNDGNGAAGAGGDAEGSSDEVQALDGTVDVRSLRQNAVRQPSARSVGGESSYYRGSDSDESSVGGSTRFATDEHLSGGGISQQYGSSSRNVGSQGRWTTEGNSAAAGQSSNRHDKVSLPNGLLAEDKERDDAIASALGIGEGGIAAGDTISGVRGRLRSITDRVQGGRRYSTVGGEEGNPDLALAMREAGRSAEEIAKASGRHATPAGVTTRALAQQAETKRLQEQAAQRRKQAQMQREASYRLVSGETSSTSGSTGSAGPASKHQSSSSDRLFSGDGASGFGPGRAGQAAVGRAPSSGSAVVGTFGSQEGKYQPGGPRRRGGLRKSLRKGPGQRRQSDASDASEFAATEKQKAIYETMVEPLEPDEVHSAFRTGNVLDAKNVQVAPSCRQQVQQLMITTNIGVGLDLGNALLSLAACFLYVIETYMVPEGVPTSAFERRAEFAIGICEMILSGFFAFDFLLRVYITEPVTDFLFTWNALLDVLTIVPVFVTFFLNDAGNDTASVLSILALARVFRVLRIIRLYRTFEYIENEVTKQSVRIGLTIMSLLFVAAGLFQITESFIISGEEVQYSFFESLWFCVVTITTVGYGDVAPHNDPGRALVIVIILTAFFAIPLETNKLLEMLAHQSEYALAYYTPPEKGSRESAFVQVLVVGNVHSASIQDFFRELLHPDHSVSVYAVVLHPLTPSEHLLDMMAEPELQGRITYIQGSPMHSKDLLRAHIHTADGCFILTNKLTTSPEAEDASAMLTALGIKKHVMAHGAHDINMYMQLIKPESKRHLMSTMPPEMSLTVVCTEQLTMNLLSMNVICPGLNTMLFNLMASDDAGEEATDEMLIEGGNRLEDQRWYHEYRRGKGFEIYRTSLSKAFALIPFYLAADVVYRQTSAMMFGLELSDQNAEGYEEQIRIILNPGTMPIPAQKGIRVKAFVIASDKATADLVGLGHARAKKATISAAAQKSLHELKRKLQKLKESLTKDKGLRMKVKRARRRSWGAHGLAKGLDPAKLDMAALQALGGSGANLPPGYRMRQSGASKEEKRQISLRPSISGPDSKPEGVKPPSRAPRGSPAKKGGRLAKIDSSAEPQEQQFRHPMTVAAMDAHQREMLVKRAQNGAMASTGAGRRGSGGGVIARQPFTTTGRDRSADRSASNEESSSFGKLHSSSGAAQAELGPGTSAHRPAVQLPLRPRSFSFGSQGKSADDAPGKAPTAIAGQSAQVSADSAGTEQPASRGATTAKSTARQYSEEESRGEGAGGIGIHGTSAPHDDAEEIQLPPGLVPSHSTLGDMELGGESFQLTSPIGPAGESTGSSRLPAVAGDSLDVSADEHSQEIQAAASAAIAAAAAETAGKQQNHGNLTAQGQNSASASEQGSGKRRTSRVAVVAVEAGSSDTDDSSDDQRGNSQQHDGSSGGREQGEDPKVVQVPEASRRPVLGEKQKVAPRDTSPASDAQSQPQSSTAPSAAVVVQSEFVHVEDPSGSSGAATVEEKSGEGIAGGSAHASFIMARRPSRRPSRGPPPLHTDSRAASAGRSLLLQRGQPRQAAGGSRLRVRRRSVSPLAAKYNSDDDIGMRIAAYRLDHLVMKLAPQGKQMAARGITTAPVATLSPAVRKFTLPQRAERGQDMPTKGSFRRRSIAGTGGAAKGVATRRRRLSWDPSVDRARGGGILGAAGGAGADGGGGVAADPSTPPEVKRAITTGNTVGQGHSIHGRGSTGPSFKGSSSSLGQSRTTIGSSVSRPLGRTGAGGRSWPVSGAGGDQSPSDETAGVAIVPRASYRWLDVVLEKPEDRARNGRQEIDLWTTQGIASAHRRFGFQSDLPESLWVQHYVAKAKAMNKQPALLRAEMGGENAIQRQRRQSDQALQVLFSDSHYGARSYGPDSESESPKKQSVALFADQFGGGQQHRAHEVLAVASQAAGVTGEPSACTTEDVILNAAKAYGRKVSRPPGGLRGLLSMGASGLAKKASRATDDQEPRAAGGGGDGVVAGAAGVVEMGSLEECADLLASPSNHMKRWASGRMAESRATTGSIGYGVGVSPVGRRRAPSTGDAWGTKPPLPSTSASAKSTASKRRLAAIRSVGRKAAMMSSVRQAISGPARWRRRYYLRQVPVRLQAATLFSVRNKKGFQGHVIISGSVNNLLHIIKPLRSRILQSCVPIVLLHAEPPSENDWKRISAFQEVFFVPGSPLSEEALGRAGIRTAACAIVLSGRDSGVLGRAAASQIEHTDATTGVTTTSGGLVDKVTLIDSEALFYAQAMLRMQPSLTTVVELIKFSNSVFLKPDVQTFRHLADDSQTSSSPMFASGSVFSPVVLDVLLCQSFFNPPIVVILEMLVLGAEGSTGRRTGSTEAMRGMTTMRGGGAMSTRIFQGKYATSKRLSLAGNASGTEFSASETTQVVKRKHRDKSKVVPQHTTASVQESQQMIARSGMRRTASGKMAPPPPARPASFNSRSKSQSKSRSLSGSMPKAPPGVSPSRAAGAQPPSKGAVEADGVPAPGAPFPHPATDAAGVQVNPANVSPQALKRLGLSKEGSGGSLESIKMHKSSDAVTGTDQNGMKKRRTSLFGTFLGGQRHDSDDDEEGLLGDDDKDKEKRRQHKRNRRQRRAARRARMQATGAHAAIEVSSSSSDDDDESDFQSSDRDSYSSVDVFNSSGMHLHRASAAALAGQYAVPGPVSENAVPYPKVGTSKVIPARAAEQLYVKASTSSSQFPTGTGLGQKESMPQLLGGSDMSDAPFDITAGTSRSGRMNTQQSQGPGGEPAPTPFVLPDASGQPSITSGGPGMGSKTSSAASSKAGGMVPAAGPSDLGTDIRGMGRKKSSKRREHKIPRDEEGMYIGRYEDESEEEGAYKDRSTLGKLLKRVRRSRVMNIPVPPRFYNKPYHQLARYLLQGLQIVPMGLYRGVYRTHGLVEAGNEHPYVVTNPDPSCEITSADGVYALGPIKELQELKRRVSEEQQSAMGSC